MHGTGTITDVGPYPYTSPMPGLNQTLAAVGWGDPLVMPKFDRLTRSVPYARAIADLLTDK